MKATHFISYDKTKYKTIIDFSSQTFFYPNSKFASNELTYMAKNRYGTIVAPYNDAGSFSNVPYLFKGDISALSASPLPKDDYLVNLLKLVTNDNVVDCFSLIVNDIYEDYVAGNITSETMFYKLFGTTYGLVKPNESEKPNFEVLKYKGNFVSTKTVFDNEDDFKGLILDEYIDKRDRHTARVMDLKDRVIVSFIETDFSVLNVATKKQKI